MSFTGHAIVEVAVPSELLPDLLPKYLVLVGTRWDLLGLAAAPLYQRVPTSPNSHKHFRDSNSLGGTRFFVDLSVQTGGSTCVYAAERLLRRTVDGAKVCHSRAIRATDAMKLDETSGHRMATDGTTGASELALSGSVECYCAAIAAANPSAAARCWPGSTQL